ncbi:MAG: 2-oxoglutarate dehydrogenase E1 component [Planctomycetota bacterium]
MAECFNMMRLDGYTVGGALHIVINNQIGFTTNPADAHSGRYCTDIAKMVDAPIFHVNGDDPEACVFAARVALAYRQQFNTDAVIDLWCYRKYGHNEGDEPRFTQPLMYERIARQEPVLRRYASQLVDEGHLTEDRFAALYEQLTGELDEAQSRSMTRPVATTVQAFRNVWSGLHEAYSDDPVDTSVPRERLAAVADALGRVPDDFEPHRALRRIMDRRGRAIAGDEPLDWAMGEMLAYGTLLQEGHAVRLTGQDVERGTFSHRHAVIFDQRDGRAHDPLNHLDPEQARFCIHNSPLTESACLGFEYGYSLGDPHMLVIWEAQFGDFANGAQVIIDQFMASAEAKWQRHSGLVMFLPHGYEGAGPEHSSARLERFLTLCADNNMQVVYPTTPAQMFHVLRRQLKRGFRKPLVVMTPKSLLRHPKAVSRVADLVDDGFHRVLDDAAVTDPAAVRRLILCSGKVAWDLLAHREKVGARDVAIVRVEQLYPLPETPLRAVLERYAGAEPVWVQEEPENMGAWRFIEDLMRLRFDVDLHYIGRDENASPAVASSRMHQQEQERLLVSAVGLPDAGAPAPSSPEVTTAG